MDLFHCSVNTQMKNETDLWNKMAELQNVMSSILTNEITKNDFSSFPISSLK